MKKNIYLSLLLLVFVSITANAQFVLNGSATITTPECSDSTTTYKLTPNLNTQAGEIWYTTQVSLTNRFDIQFEMFLGNKAYTIGADGICFVFQQQSVNAGSSGGGMGYGGITPSLAVEFDTYQNGWDPAFCHTAIEKNGDVNHTDNSGNNLAGPLQLSPTNPNLPDGAWHNVEIIWNPVTDSISMYFDCVFRIAYHGDIIDSIFGSNPNVYWGFTAGTGGEDNLQEICVAHSYLNNLRDTAVCIGNSVQLTAGGGVSYVWSPGTDLNTDSSATVVATPTATTTYTVTIKNACGLISTDSVTIGVNPVPAFSMGTPTNILCNGANTGSATVTSTGGVSPYTYLWSPSGGSNATGTGLTAGTYTVHVNDINGCGATTLTVTITQPTALNTTITTDSATCLNNDGKISVTVSGGSGTYTYLWNPGANTNASYTGLSSGNYTVTITDSSGCAATVSGNVGLDKTFTLTVSWPDSACIGKSISLSASGAGNYLWSNSTTSASQNVTLSGDTTYWVIGTTGVCKDTMTHNIKVYKLLAATKLFNDSICPGLPITLRVKATGGKPAYTYSWNNGITSDSPGPITVYPTASTTYTVVITDQCNYTVTDSMHVKVFPSGNASFTANPTIVPENQAVDFTNTSQNSDAYYWSFGDGNTATGVTPTHAYTEPGTYQVLLIAYNIDGCPDTATEDIDVTPPMIIPNVFSPNSDAINDVLYFTIGGATCYHINIYNRWGELVYESQNILSGWDGKIRQTGDLASDGTYYYVINYCDYKNVPHNLDGFIQLVRAK